GTAAITQAVGLSLALGAFVAGLVVSGSEYTREALGHLLPLRDAFVALFFVTIGMLIDPTILLTNIPLLLTMVGLIIVGKFVIGVVVVKVFGYSIWTAALAALGRTQIGEFSFVLVQVARQAKLVGDDVYNATLAASLVTILLNAALVKYGSQWLGDKRLQSTPMHAHEDDDIKQWNGHIVVCGFGRMGGPAGTAFDTFNLPFVVIEIDPEVVRKARAKGIHCLYGDPAHRPVLEGAHTDRAALVIVTVPEADRAYLTVRNIREINPTVPILARAHRRVDFEALLVAGATRVVQPEVEASATLIGDALHIAGVAPDQVDVYLQQYREAMKLAESAPSQFPGSMPELKLIPVERLGATGKSLRESNIREQFGLTVVAVRRASGEKIFNPAATTVLNAGDQVQVLGLQNQLEEAAGS
ncbi:MAG: cation:proton antiporter, partial [Terriglobales bacterium]